MFSVFIIADFSGGVKDFFLKWLTELRERGIIELGVIVVSSKQALFNEIETLPKNIIDEVFHYVLFLKQKVITVGDLAIASERSLAKDWLKPEEDAAWANLKLSSPIKRES